MRRTSARNGLTFARIWGKDGFVLRSSAAAQGHGDRRSGMKLPILPRLRCCVAALTVMFCVWSPTYARAQEEGPVTSKGENFSAKPPAALFNSDCTGAGCHKGPQGLVLWQSQSGLAGFLREHYTNSRERAAALAGYLLKVPAGPEPRAARPP